MLLKSSEKSPRAESSPSPTYLNMMLRYQRQCRDHLCRRGLHLHCPFPRPPCCGWPPGARHAGWRWTLWKFLGSTDLSARRTYGIFTSILPSGGNHQRSPFLRAPVNFFSNRVAMGRVRVSRSLPDHPLLDELAHLGNVREDDFQQRLADHPLPDELVHLIHARSILLRT